jgi:hypothetical protein
MDGFQALILAYTSQRAMLRWQEKRILNVMANVAWEMRTKKPQIDLRLSCLNALIGTDQRAFGITSLEARLART